MNIIHQGTVEVIGIVGIPVIIIAVVMVISGTISGQVIGETLIVHVVEDIHITVGAEAQAGAERDRNLDPDH